MNTNQVYNEDCFETIKRIPDKFINLFFYSPPYNIGVKYDNYNDNLSSQEYLEFHFNLATQLLPKIKDSGSLVVNIGNRHTQDIFKAHNVAREYIRAGWIPLDTIIWNKENTNFNSSERRLSNRYEFLFHFVRTQDYYFDKYSIGIPLSDKYLKDKRYEKSRQQRLEKIGKLVRDIGNVWDISIKKRKQSSDSIDHPCPFPVELAERIIRLTTKENDIVYDPFAGEGNTAIACILNNRKYILSEISKNYCEKAELEIKKHRVLI